MGQHGWVMFTFFNVRECTQRFYKTNKSCKVPKCTHNVCMYLKAHPSMAVATWCRCSSLSPALYWLLTSFVHRASCWQCGVRQVFIVPCIVLVANVICASCIVLAMWYAPSFLFVCGWCACYVYTAFTPGRIQIWNNKGTSIAHSCVCARPCNVQ